MSKQVKKKEAEKLVIEKTTLECRHSVLRLTEERRVGKETLDKVERQKEKLAELCKLLQSQKSS